MVLLIVLVTSIVSILAFSNHSIIDKLSFKPTKVINDNEWHRLLSYSLVHADWIHLGINMYVFFMFGQAVLDSFKFYFGSGYLIHFGALYLLAIIFSNGYGLFKHRNNRWYSAIGASGGVMAIVFTSIFFEPLNMLYFFGIVPIPGIVFGILYLAYSVYMGKKNMDNIGHDAHLIGALVGFIYPIIVNPNLFSLFIEKLLN